MVKKKRINKIKALALASVLLVAGTIGVAKRNISQGETVVSVIDGDSFKIGRDQTVRLSSLDAPEVEYCYGKEAKDYLTQKINGKKVILKEFQPDRYGRLMAIVYTEDGEMVNEYMVKNGLALHIWDTSKQNQVLDVANNFARKNKLGIFSSECFQQVPPNPKCAIKGNIVQATKAKEYTLLGCDHYSQSVIEKYKGEEWFCSEKEAKAAGFIKSSNCK